MKQDELLDELGRLARAQAERAPEGPDADELLRPFDAATHGRIVARLLPVVRAEMSSADATAAPTPHAAQTAPRRPRPRRWWMVVAPAVVAALVLLWFVRPQADAALPAYALELRGGQTAERGVDASAVLRVGRDDLVSAVLRPARPVDGAVAVRVCLDGKALPDAQAAVDTSADGALRVSDLGPALAAFAPGRHRLQFAVGRPGSLPGALLNACSAVAAGVQLLDYEVEHLPQ